MTRRADGMPWSKFWWQDYDRDPALRRCSLDAEGLWMRLLCIMAEAEPYGRLLVGGTVPSAREIACMVGRGLTERAVSKLMAELLRHSVYSLDAEGVPYSRRMVREVEQREQARINGSKGGNPALMKGGDQDKSGGKSAEIGQENNGNASGRGDAVSSEINGLADLGVNPHANPSDKLQEARGKRQTSTGSLRSPAAVTASQVMPGVEQVAAAVSLPPEASRSADVPADPFDRDLFAGAPAVKPGKPARAARPAPADDDGPPVPRTPKAILFSDGLRACADMAQVKPDSLRSWMVKLLDAHAGGDAALALQPIMEAHARWVQTGKAPGDIKSAMIFAVQQARGIRKSAPSRTVPVEVAGRNVERVVAYCGDIVEVCYNGLWEKHGSPNEFSLLIADALEAGLLPEGQIAKAMRDASRHRDKVNLGPAWFRTVLGLRNLRAVA